MTNWKLNDLTLNDNDCRVLVTEVPQNRNFGTSEMQIHGRLNPVFERGGGNAPRVSVTFLLRGSDRYQRMEDIIGICEENSFVRLSADDKNIFRNNKSFYATPIRHSGSYENPVTVKLTVEMAILGLDNNSLSAGVVSVQRPNDWNQVGITVIGLPQSAVVEEGGGSIVTRGSTPCLITPTFANDSSYVANEVKSGVLRISVNPDEMFNNSCKVYDDTTQIFSTMHVPEGDVTLQNDEYKVTLTGGLWMTLSYYNSGWSEIGHVGLSSSTYYSSKITITHIRPNFVRAELQNGASVELESGKPPLFTPVDNYFSIEEPVDFGAMTTTNYLELTGTTGTWGTDWYVIVNRKSCVTYSTQGRRVIPYEDPSDFVLSIMYSTNISDGRRIILKEIS